MRRAGVPIEHTKETGTPWIQGGHESEGEEMKEHIHLIYAFDGTYRITCAEVGCK